MSRCSQPEYEKLARMHYAWTLSGEWLRMAMIRELLKFLKSDARR